MLKKRKLWMSWSSGKDSAFALQLLRSNPEFEVTGLLTTVTETYHRVAMHAVREELLAAQAAAIGLPLHVVRIPAACTNADYEARMSAAVEQARREGVSAMGFGDLFLDDIRSYRERNLAGTGIDAVFPLWQCPTPDLAREMIQSGLKAVLTCVDPRVLDDSFAGRAYDEALLGDLPHWVDPCGERGEFHSFVHDGPMFREPLSIQVGSRVLRDGFVFADVLSAPRPDRTSRH